MGFDDQKPLNLGELKHNILSEKPTWTYTTDVQSFQIYHSYFSCYCAQVANNRGIPYTPNPSRFPLFLRQSTCDFYYPDLRRRIIEEFGEIRRQYLVEVSQYFRIVKEQLDFPLVAGYLWSKTKKPRDLLLYAIDLRHSKEAVAFRDFCRTAEKSSDLAQMLELKKQIRDFADRLRRDISLSPSRRGIAVRKCGISSGLRSNHKTGNLQNDSTNLPNKLGLTTTPDHFIFLHNLIRGV